MEQAWEVLLKRRPSARLRSNAGYIEAEATSRGVHPTLDCAGRHGLSQAIPQVCVANLRPELPAHEVYWTVGDGTECKNPKKSVVAATLEKARTYVFAGPLVWDREVGGSNPLAPTKNLNPIDNLRGVD